VTTLSFEAITPDSLALPVNRASLTYWLSKRGGRSMPSRADLDPAEIVSILPYVFLLDVAREPLDFRYRLIGTRMAQYMTSDHTGGWMSQIDHQRPPSRIWSSCEAVVRNKAPLTSDIPYVGINHDFLSTEDVMMPLSDDDREVNMIFVTADFLKRAGVP
jgi:hypothetical protein